MASVPLVEEAVERLRVVVGVDRIRDAFVDIRARQVGDDVGLLGLVL